jgi:hypothetical protein
VVRALLILPKLVSSIKRAIDVADTCVSVPGTDNCREKSILTRRLVEMSRSGR